MTKHHHPDMPTDTDYLQGVAASTAQKAKRDIRFDLLNEDLEAFELPDLYKLVSADSIQADQVKRILDLWHQKINVGVSDIQRQKLVALWQYLAADDSETLQPADIIFVFGGPETTKAHKAVELYKAGMAKRCIFTGDTQRALAHLPHQSESVRDAEIAIAAGIPREAILIENTSVNTTGNVQNAIQILSGAEPFPTRLIVANLPWYLLRSTNTFLTFWQDAPVPATSIQRVNAGSDQFAPESYFKSREGLEYVVFEYLKMKQAREMGHM